MRFLLALLFISGSLFCQQLTEEQKVQVQKELQAAFQASQDFVKLLDEGKYAESWDQSSDIFKLTIAKEDWVASMQKIRSPLGKETSREMQDIRIAVNPKGLPQGDYIVVIFETSFSNKPKAMELVTLRFVEGTWKVLTYQVT